MTRWQWHDVLRDGLGKDFTCLADADCYSDEYLNLIMVHYGR